MQAGHVKAAGGQGGGGSSCSSDVEPTTNRVAVHMLKGEGRSSSIDGGIRDCVLDAEGEGEGGEGGLGGGELGSTVQAHSSKDKLQGQSATQVTW